LPTIPERDQVTQPPLILAARIWLLPGLGQHVFFPCQGFPLGGETLAFAGAITALWIDLSKPELRLAIIEFTDSHK